MSSSISQASCAMLLCRFGILFLAASPASGSLIMRRSQLALSMGLHGFEPEQNKTLVARGQDTSTDVSTCGYLNGDPSRPRTANSGYDCRVDAANQLWGFCPTTVIAASDCGLAGSCVDKYRCSRGCGFVDKTQLTTFTCASNEYCSTALLTFGVDQTYSYIGCGGSPQTDHYLAVPTAQATPTKETSTSETKPKSTVSEPTSTISNAKITSVPSSTPAVTNMASLPTASPSNGPVIPAPGTSESSSGKSNNLGAIIGGVIGGLALICASAVLIIFLLRRSRLFNPAPNNDPSPPYLEKKEYDRRSAMPQAWTSHEMSAASRPPSFVELSG